MEAVATGRPITMPVGTQVKGRLMNVNGEPIDGMEPMSRTGALPIHREAPKFDELSPAQEVLHTGIKVIDLIEPYARWLNGEEALLMSGDRRMVVDDCVSKRLTLKKGINVLRGTIINGPGMSDFCVRFLDANGKPLNQLKIK